MNTGGLNCPWALTHVQSRDMSAPLTAGIRHSPGGLLSAGGSVCEGGDSCFVSQEKLKPGFLKEIPEKIKLFSEFLGKRPWFAGDKVSWPAVGAGELSFFPGSEFGVHSCFVLLQLTYVDFLVYDVLDMHRIFEPKCLDAFPNLRDFISRFEVIRLNPLYLHLSSLSYFP